ncbi:hypothetical protein WNZ15_17650 [Roseibium sp. AS2]|uniref:hypothetical protein n=1 Tax=Roseibium sp. AS2 TaxID=3135781 RepID=UPI00317951E1
MSSSKPGIGDYTFIIMARALASLVLALGVTLAVVLSFSGAYVQAAVGLILFLFLAFWTSCLIRDFAAGKVLLPPAYLHRARQTTAFWFFFWLYGVLILALIAGAWWYLPGTAIQSVS